MMKGVFGICLCFPKHKRGIKFKSWISKFLKDRLPQNLLSPLLNTLPQIRYYIKVLSEHTKTRFLNITNYYYNNNFHRKLRDFKILSIRTKYQIITILFTDHVSRNSDKYSFFERKFLKITRLKIIYGSYVTE